MTERAHIVVVGSGFAGSLVARVLATQGLSVILLERRRHPRFAIGESTTPLANLSLERLARRYGLSDLYHLAAHGRWRLRYPDVRGGLKRGFTFYRHHPGAALATSERLLVAASPDAFVSDSHWLRADVDHHLVREAVVAGVDYRDCAELTAAEFDDASVRLSGLRNDRPFTITADFVIDASGPNGFLARHLRIRSGLDRTYTRSGLVFGHFDNVRFMDDVVAGLSPATFVDDWAAVHHIVDEGWMYSLRFDHGVVSAGFTLSPRGLASLPASEGVDPAALWRTMLDRYPTLAAAFEHATPVIPIGFVRLIQHRLTRAAGDRWLMLPHAYAFVDPLFSTGIAWALRAIERVGQMFEGSRAGAMPQREELQRYAAMLEREADQIDQLVAGAYEAMAHFDLFAAQAMIYFATVSFAEVRQRITAAPDAAWSGFLGVGDTVCDPIPRESLDRLREITQGRAHAGSSGERAAFVEWVRRSIEPRNVVGLADPARNHLYPVDLDVLIDNHAKLGLSRDQMMQALPALRGYSESGSET